MLKININVFLLLLQLSVLNVGQQIDHGMCMVSTISVFLQYLILCSLMHAVMFYASVEEKKLLQTVPVGNLSTDIQFYMWVIVQKNMTIEYDTMKYVNIMFSVCES